MKKHQNEKGFTIIEVVLVLAIAALIFLMVFIALPALQRSQRDTARKSDVGLISSAVSSYTGNNNGTFPASGSIDLDSYTKNKSDNTTSVVIGAGVANDTVTPTDGQVIVTKSTTCGGISGGTVTLASGTTRQYTVITRLEEGSGVAYCQNN